MSKKQRAVSSKPHQFHSRAVPLSSPGVLILGMTREPLYVTPGTHKFLEEIDGSKNASWNGTALPLVVQHLCDELQHDGRQDLTGMDWDKTHVRHLAQTASGTILIRGYGIIGQRGTQTGRFLILFENVPTDSSVPGQQRETSWHFTARQRGILNGLVLGLSNKEIAASMAISVHTVKEYIRQLMMKLHAPSRTGIVARVAGLTLPPPNMPSHPRSQSAPSSIQIA